MHALHWALLVVVALSVALPPPVHAIGAREAAETFRREHPRSTLIVHEQLDSAHLVVLHDAGTARLWRAIMHVCVLYMALGGRSRRQT